MTARRGGVGIGKRKETTSSPFVVPSDFKAVLGPVESMVGARPATVHLVTAVSSRRISSKRYNGGLKMREWKMEDETAAAENSGVNRIERQPEIKPNGSLHHPQIRLK